MLHVAPAIIQSKIGRISGACIQFLGETSSLTQHMDWLRGKAPLPFIVGIDDDKNTVGISSEGIDSTEAAVHCDLNQNGEDQTQRFEKSSVDVVTINQFCLKTRIQLVG